MEQLIDNDRGLCGASSDDIVDCHKLAIEAWGDRCEERDSGMLAFAYLWRRFGPPWGGGDPHKTLVDYTLTTADPDVFLWLHLSGAGLSFSVGYLADESIRDEAFGPKAEWCKKYDNWWWEQHPEFEQWEDTEENQKKVAELYWDERTKRGKEAVAVIGEFPPRADLKNWRSAGGVVTRVNQAIFDAMQELLVTVYVRDCPINIFGRCEDSDCCAEPSEYAGYGLESAKSELDKYVAGDK